MNLKGRKPPRPFGVGLAIISTTTLFALAPLVQVIFWLQLKNNIQIDENGMRFGVDLLGIDERAFYVQGAIAFAFLMIAIITWRGRPQWMRIFFSICVLIYGLIAIIGSVRQLILAQDASISSAETFTIQAACVQIGFSLFLIVYVVWFMNRWSARAFFRGFYTESDLQLLAEADRHSD
ncbi:hypothetical protein MASR2M15_28970 [Anaerolineales bacterium]